ncbi:MAG: hypothetical protein HDQ88_11785 [Clostridia bacterium]|nr:hypothetical protein [Clostridia bacterium]
MKITEERFKVSDLVQGYKKGDMTTCRDGELILVDAGCDGHVLCDEDRDYMIQCMLSGFPIGVFHLYRKSDTMMKVMDGVARLCAICEYTNDGFPVNGKAFSKLKPDLRAKFQDYEITAYVCDGSQQECFQWLSRMRKYGYNSLTEQNISDTVFSSPWRDDARVRLMALVRENPDYFADDAVGRIVEIAVAWAANREDITSEEWLADYEVGDNADVLVRYVTRVIDWVKEIFSVVRPEIMKGQPWGELFNDYGNKIRKPDKVEAIVKNLVDHPDIGNKMGIYEYILCGDDDCLNVKKFKKQDLQAVLDAQGGKCAKCGCELAAKDAKLMLIQDFKSGGRVELMNAMAVCKKCGKESR